MNIVYIHTHDSGRYLDPYGVKTGTPAIQSFAEGATLFRQAFSAAPTCSPSRAALLTGMNPHSCGMLGLAHRGFSLDDYRKHIVHQLNEEGYDTALCGIQHVAEDVEKIGYKEILDTWNFDMSAAFTLDTTKFDRLNASTAAQYIKSHRNSKTPFFLSFGMFNTHRKFPPADPEIKQGYVAVPPQIRDTPENREDFAGFMTSARIVDSCFQTVIDAVNESGLREKTLIIFTTDHGIAFPDMKCSLYDTGIGVSLLIDYPGNRMKGEVSDALVSHLDIYPTICDLAGLERPSWLEGFSLKPLMEKRTASVREEIFAEVTYHAAYEPMRCIRTADYKLIKRFDTPIDVVPSNIDDSSAKSRILDSGYMKKPMDEISLYNLNFDPLERINLADVSGFETVREELHARLESWMKKTGDPLLAGAVPLPKGAFANKKNSISPRERDFNFGL